MAAAKALDLDPETIITISGLETSTEGPFNLSAGVLVMSGTSGGGNFAVTLQQEDELARELAFNEVGKYNGRSVIPIGIGPLKPGPVNLKVISSKEWTFEYSQELSSAARSTPFEFSGSGDDISPAIEFTPGTHAIMVSYDGPEFQFFAVNLYAADGSDTEFLTRIDPDGKQTSEGTFEFEIVSKGQFGNQPGAWIVDVDTGGDWEISVM